MPHELKRSTLLLSLLLVFAAYPAAAQITGAAVSLPERPSGFNSVAYDSVNQVYLVSVAGSGTVFAKFLNKAGAPIGGPFAITTPGEAPYIGWVGVFFGGTPSDPAFLVTYVTDDGGGSCFHSKHGRLIRYRPGQAPLVSARSYITNVGCEWPSAEKAQAAWTGAQFVVGTRVNAGGPNPQPEVRAFDLGGTVSAPVILGDFLDYYGSPAIACASDGVCLVSGYANGIPSGGRGGSYARLINGVTLQPITNMFYLDDHSGRNENQNVVFNSKTGQFLTAWYQGPASTVDTAVVAHDGTLLSRNVAPIFAGLAGDIALNYNPGTGSAILTSKNAVGNTYGLFAVEVDGNGSFPNPANQLLVAAWDNKWPEFTPSIAANAADKQWLALAVQTSGGRAVIIQGGTPTPIDVTARKGDFSNDGKADIVLQRDDGVLSLWTMNGTTAVSTSFLNPAVVEPEWRIVATGDLNGDGKADLVWQHAGGWLAVWYMNGATMVSCELLNSGQPVATDWKIVGAADFNGDGKADLVWQHTDGWLAVWFMSGSTLVSAQLLNPVQVTDSDWKIVGVGDFNADGKPDLVWQHKDGWLSLWYMNGLAQFGAVYFTPIQVADTDWKIRGVIDLNGDGKTDLIWQHMSDGLLAAWLMNGTTAVNTLYLNPTSVGSSWKVMGPR